jgi:hypothetical protein
MIWGLNSGVALLLAGAWRRPPGARASAPTGVAPPTPTSPSMYRYVYRVRAFCALRVLQVVVASLVDPPSSTAGALSSVLEDSIADSRQPHYTAGFRWTPELMATSISMGQEDEGSKAAGETQQPRDSRASCHVPAVVAGNDLGRLPALYTGRLHFLNSSGAGFRCSGAFIAPSVVLTAGHCCKEDGQWHTDFQFTTQYGTSRSRTFSSKTAHTSKSWGNAGSKRWDLDFCFIETQTVAPGSLRVATLFKPGYVPLLNSFGYAKNYGGGQEMYNVTGSFVKRTGDSRSGTLEMDCEPMNSGNSGGPWIVTTAWGSRGRATVAGLNSYHQTSQPNFEFTPYFGKTFVAICETAGACQCAAKLANLCNTAKASSAGQCQTCAGLHASMLRAVGCVNDDIDDYCSSGTATGGI